MNSPEPNSVLHVCHAAAPAVAVRDARWQWRTLVENGEAEDLRELCTRVPEPIAAVIEATVQRPLMFARQVLACSPLAQVIFLRDEGPGAADRGALRAFDLPGGSWVVLSSDDAQLSAKLAEQITIGERRRRHRTTLDKVNARLNTGAAVDNRTLHRLVISERFLASVMKHSPDAVLTLSMDRQILSWNASAEKLWGFTAAQAQGRRLEEILENSSRPRLVQCIEAVKAESGHRREELCALASAGQRTPIEVTIAPVLDERNTVIAYSAIVRDITERNRVRREIEEARDRALAAARAKDDFLAALSHELRTPLNPVLLIASDAAEDPRLAAEVRADFALIRDNVQLEARLIDDLLDLTRIARRKLTLDRQIIEAHEVLRETIGIVHPDIADKRLELEVDFAAEQSRLRADPVRLRQIFWNVLKNAAKFTPAAGRIVVRTRNAMSRSRLVVSVSDTGIGMTPQELQRVFDAFSQGEHAEGRSHRFGGLGLGLAISRMLMELHGGSIRASSRGRGEGSVFELEFPVGEEQTLPDESEASPDSDTELLPEERQRLRGERVLLVEDHDATRLTLASLLRRRRLNVATAASLAEARRLAEDGKITLLLSDIGLPDGSGCDLMREMKERFGTKGIALTGYGGDQDVTRSKAAGFTTHLTKPIATRALDRALAALVQQPG